MLGFGYLSALDATGAHAGSFNGSCKVDFNPLQVRKETAQGFTNDFRPGPTFAANHTTSFIFNAWDGTFAANFTYFSHNVLPSCA